MATALKAFQRLFDPKTVGVAYASIQYGIKNGRAVGVRGRGCALGGAQLRSVDRVRREVTLTGQAAAKERVASAMRLFQFI